MKSAPIHKPYNSVTVTTSTIPLSQTTAAENEVPLSYHRVRGLYFLALVFAALVFAALVFAALVFAATCFCGDYTIRELITNVYIVQWYLVFCLLRTLLFCLLRILLFCLLRILLIT